MLLISLDKVGIAYGHVALLDNVELRVESGERICLIGRNGEGKSTLLKIISSEIKPDHGRVERQASTRIAYLAQEPEFEATDTIFHAVAKGLGTVGTLMESYHALTQELTHTVTDELLAQLEKIQHQLEAQDGWMLEQKVETVLSRLELPADKKISELSGGWKRRVALAQILIQEPDLLLLDEPTNHLDIEAIDWLEEILINFKGGLLFVSHDRRFMQRVANRIIELDRGKLVSYPSDYETYLQLKEANLAAEATHNAKFDKVLAQEEVWIRQGIKARRTRNEGRVRALKKLREERKQRREKMGTIRLTVEQGDTSGRIVIEAEKINKFYSDKAVIRDFSTVIFRGDRIGLIGTNGAGKTTLLKILLGELAPDSGSIKHGTKLNVVYFDQLRAQLDPEQSVFDVISEGQDFIELNGQRKHVMSYLADFLFPPARARSPVKSLSGGERNRLLLARLFTKPANVLVLDEPTNDLDVESLELLEELLSEYTGTLLLVSHDRRFLDNVVTSTIVFEGEGNIAEYVGGYEDWLYQRPATIDSGKPTTVVKKAEKTTPPPVANKGRKLSYKEQKELTELPLKIEQLEKQLHDLQLLMSAPEFYRKPAAETSATTAKLQKVEAELKTVYARWEALEQ
ncbi:ATP-binding cassette domain-containing protein [Beggiatoa leptomitoformis]|uniref:ATP-binding protein Uup n=1 Tax=Beggiatoa leptomitoformis TaxID=288004 RepID=A0A2N9Y9Y4_9GAMM|nr:ATP-binding cassette domain-containing protein [Beggiatoa leptomitoformis]ALG67300.1 ATP-binding cassette domain-containing protein [Beggiatoa leptomitoformis]AUI67268.1 ATP-binding cassette domain-containing protein [Beggiatoa leptomitoformis]